MSLSESGECKYEEKDQENKEEDNGVEVSDNFVSNFRELGIMTKCPKMRRMKMN